MSYFQRFQSHLFCLAAKTATTTPPPPPPPTPLTHLSIRSSTGRDRRTWTSGTSRSSSSPSSHPGRRHRRNWGRSRWRSCPGSLSRSPPRPGQSEAPGYLSRPDEKEHRTKYKHFLLHLQKHKFHLKYYKKTQVNKFFGEHYSILIMTFNCQYFVDYYKSVECLLFVLSVVTLLLLNGQN